MSLNKRDSDVGGMLSVPRSKAPAPVFNFSFASEKGAKGDKGDPGGGGGGGGTTTDVTKPPKPPRPPKPPGGGGDPGTYTPGDPVKPIKPGDDVYTALDKFTTGIGAFDAASQGPGKHVDPGKASDLATLAKGAGAGTGDTKKANESAIANLLSLGQPNPVSGGDKGKGDSGGNVHAIEWYKARGLAVPAGAVHRDDKGGGNKDTAPGASVIGGLLAGGDKDKDKGKGKKK